MRGTDEPHKQETDLVYFITSNILISKIYTRVWKMYKCVENNSNVYQTVLLCITVLLCEKLYYWVRKQC